MIFFAAIIVLVVFLIFVAVCCGAAIFLGCVAGEISADIYGSLFDDIFEVDIK